MATKKSLSKKGYKKGGRKTNGRKTRGRKMRKTYKKNMKGGDCTKMSPPLPNFKIVYIDNDGNPVKTSEEAAQLQVDTIDEKGDKVKKSTKCPSWRYNTPDIMEKIVRIPDPGRNKTVEDYLHASEDYPNSCCNP
jgi:hypothetical protein